MSLNVRPLPACVTASKAVVFLLDNCPSLFLPGVTRVPEPHFCSVIVQSFIIVFIKNLIFARCPPSFFGRLQSTMRCCSLLTEPLKESTMWP